MRYMRDAGVDEVENLVKLLGRSGERLWLADHDQTFAGRPQAAR